MMGVEQLLPVEANGWHRETTIPPSPRHSKPAGDGYKAGKGKFPDPDSMARNRPKILFWPREDAPSNRPSGDLDKTTKLS
jgi:hypothetical protein